MHDEQRPAAPPPVTGGHQKPKPEPITDYAHVSMGEEFSGAKWRLPPMGVVAIALLVVAVIVGIIAVSTRPKPGATGSIDDVGVAATDPDNVMVAVQFSMTNVTEKPFWVKSVSAKLQDADGREHSDTAASVADFERYFQAFPDLRQHAAGEPVKQDTKIMPGGKLQGSAIFSFPVSRDAFEKRKSLSVVIQPYDQPRAVVLTK